MSLMAGQIQDLLRARQDLATLEERNRLARDLHNFAGIKDSSGDLTLTGEIIRRTPSSFKVFLGRDSVIFPALMMGASGVQLGTKFAVAEESVAHKNFKRALLRAAAKDAVPTAQFDPRMPVIPVRALTNEGTRDFNTLQLGLVAQLEREAITAREAGLKLEEFWIGGLRKAAIDGDVKAGSLMAGQSVGLVKEILPVREILDQLIEEGVEEAEKILGRLGR